MDAFGAVAAILRGGLHHVGADHLHLYHHLRAHDRDLPCHQHRAHPHGHHDGQGMGRHGAELSPLPVGFGVSGLSHHHLHRHLCGAGTEYAHRRQHFHGHLAVHGLHGAALLHPVQNQQSRKVNFQQSLTEVNQYGIRSRTQRPERGQDQGAAEPDEAPARLLRRGRSAGRSAVLPAQSPYRRQHGGDLHDPAHAALFPAGHV